MGTSSSYPGPTGRNPLLPPWADDPATVVLDDPGAGPAEAAAGNSNGSLAVSDDHAPQSASPVVPLPLPRPWRGAKIAMREVARTGAGSDPKIQRLGRRFVGALGGSRRATASTGAGRATARNLGAFLAGVARDGIQRTLERLNLSQYLGQPVSVLLTALGRVLAPAGATTEEASAATAYHETMAELVEELVPPAGGVDVFNRMDEDLIRWTMERYVANVIVTRLLQVLTQQLEGGAVTPERAVAVEFEIRDYVQSAIELTFSNDSLTTLDWDSPTARTLVDRLFRQGYGIFGGTR